jgi:hypothetical protein
MELLLPAMVVRISVWYDLRFPLGSRWLDRILGLIGVVQLFVHFTVLLATIECGRFHHSSHCRIIVIPRQGNIVILEARRAPIARLSVEIAPQANNTRTGEDAENLSLMWCEFYEALVSWHELSLVF